jgi:superfamily I DNA/RNA helicase
LPPARTGFARGNEFFSGEIQWIEQHGITSLPQYLQAERVGRDGVPLDRKSRLVAFGVLQDYLARRKAAHKDFDWDDMATAVCEEMDADSSSRLYKHIVIDEGQDFSPQMIRSLAKGIPQDGSLTYFGDMAQQIYGRRMSWKSAGLNVSKVWEFKENYRNTKQVAALGLAISRMPYFKETPDLVEPIAPKADGPLPALVECSSVQKEIALVRDQAVQAAKTQTVAVLARNWELANTVAKHLPRSSVKLDHDLSTWQAGPKIYYGTFHGAKGLEFDTVILPFFSTTTLPEPEQVRAFGEEEAQVLDGKLVYVGVTRAKTRLIMTFSNTTTVGPLTPEKGYNPSVCLIAEKTVRAAYANPQRPGVSTCTLTSSKSNSCLVSPRAYSNAPPPPRVAPVNLTRDPLAEDGIRGNNAAFFAIVVAVHLRDREFQIVADNG